ncbi:alpha/beta hydrolase [Planctobacterium marinum]|uniref:Alpha/beta hydrolase n=1 Tax=Planctobacterium marinum TaxID=1631968 RepID=A0AA48HHM0_9ALTE|nr:hypothetical protein MACH26_03470 [Planctobacterium marinum]
MKRLFFLLSCLLLPATCLHAENVESLNLEDDKYPGYSMPRTQVIPLRDTSNAKQYELYIKLPENYQEDSDMTYPVIYFTDAVWHIEVLSAAHEYLLPESILVGISWQQDSDAELVAQYGAHASRFSDYSHWDKANPNHPKLKFGGAEKHLAFIRKDVLPFVQKHYRTQPDKRSYFGYSLGGGFGAYILLNQPDTFQNYILGSPSVKLFTEGDPKRFNRAELKQTNIFIAHGDLEENRAEDIKAFIAKFEQSAQQPIQLRYKVISGDHSTAFPETAIESIRWLKERFGAD